ncbi:MAG: RsmB/NOP family class I SAM-dependent RNA methyltransferase [Alphaproteobacteria bacterium]
MSDKKPFNKGDKPFNKDRKPFNKDRKPFDKDRKPFDKDKPNFKGRKQFTNKLISPRLGAFYLLEAALVDKKPLEFVEHRTLKQIDPKNRGLARMIAYTALRHNVELDLLINEFVDEEIFTPQVEIFLKVGLTQILYMDVADHAAVSETINAVFGKALPSKGMINAILRRGVDEGKDFLKGHTDVINMPKYLWRSWVNTYGEKPARQILEVLQTQAPVDITVKKDPETWAEKLDGKVLPTGGVRLKSGGKIVTLEGFETGDWWVQDLSAQIPVHLMGDIAGKKVIDLCSAPGGKTSQLLARGAKVIAVDHNEFRLNKMRENMERLDLNDNLTIKLSDAVKYQVGEKADIVLLDAPCSATGTIRKNPDLPYIKDSGLISSVAKLQRQMLTKAVDMVKEGGMIVFATCSLQPEEGEHHLKDLPEGLKVLPVRRKEVPGLEKAITPKGVLRILPTMYEDGCDGFFIARFIKT